MTEVMVFNKHWISYEIQNSNSHHEFHYNYYIVHSKNFTKIDTFLEFLKDFSWKIMINSLFSFYFYFVFCKLNFAFKMSYPLVLTYSLRIANFSLENRFIMWFSHCTASESLGRPVKQCWVPGPDSKSISLGSLHPNKFLHDSMLVQRLQFEKHSLV